MGWVFGTMLADAIHVGLGIPYAVSTLGFGIALVVIFSVWYRTEKTLSIHSVYTTKREAFYWLAILFTFALGTAAGDLIAERIDVGYWKSALLFDGAIVLVTLSWRFLKLNAILA